MFKLLATFLKIFAAPLRSALTIHPFADRYNPRLIGEIATRTRQIFAELAIEKGWDILALEVASDHIHLFVSVKPTDTPHLVIKAFKGRSSFYLRKEFPQLKKLPSLWTSSYFVSTAGNVSSEAVRRYIEDPHHG
jgi:putative transposase